MLKEILVKIIPHLAQRYPTVGDWYYKRNALQIRISDLNNDDFNLLVTVHEMIEAHLCERAGVKESDVTAFDIQFEAERSTGMHSSTDEPGDDPSAPYYVQHQIATTVERYLAQALSVNWEEYDAAVNSL